MAYATDLDAKGYPLSGVDQALRTRVALALLCAQASL